MFGPRELRSPYVWKPYVGSKPLINEMNIRHHGKSEAVIRALTDFGSEESFEHAAKRFAEHDKYLLHTRTGSRVIKQIAAEACA